MALSFVNYTATSGQTEFAFSFPYLSTDHVKVQINGVDTAAYTVVTSPSTKIVLTSGATAGANVKVYRKTPGRSASPDNVNLVDFVNGSVLSEEDLDKSNKQLLYLVQESDDTGSGALGPTFDDTAWDATNLQIKNLAQPTAGTDAATKGYVDGLSLYGSAVVTPQVWTFTTAAQTDYTLSPPALTTDPNMFILDIGGVPQRPTTNFTITNNGATLSLVATPAAGVSACLRNFGATRNVQGYAAPVTFSDTVTFNASPTVNATLVATNLTSVGYASLDGIWISNANSDSTSIYIGEQGAAQTASNQGNTAVGRTALSLTTSGAANSAFGRSALYANTSGFGNSAFGNSALPGISASNNNTALGYASLLHLTSGHNNTGIGSASGRYFGAGTDQLSSSSNSVFIGFASRAKQNTSSNEIVIGASTVGEGSNTSTIGNSSTTDAKIYGTLTTTGNLNVQGIGTTTIAGPVSATGNVTVGGTLTASGNTWPQCVMTHSAAQLAYSASAANRAGAVKIAALDTTITPRSASSKILVSYSLNFEAPHDSMFYLIRRVGGVATEIGSSAPSGTRLYGFCIVPYDANDFASTQTLIAKSYLDSPNTTSAVTYELWWYTQQATLSFLLNRTANNADGTELGTSQCILQEYFA